MILGRADDLPDVERRPGYATADFSHVRFFISGGAPCPVPLINAWRAEKGVVFRQGYGLTEVGPNCFSMTDDESVPKTGSVGKPIFHSEMRLVAPDEPMCRSARWANCSSAGPTSAPAIGETRGHGHVAARWLVLHRRHGPARRGRLL